MKLPDKIFIAKEQMLESFKADIQKSIENPQVTVESIEWTEDGIIAHLTYGKEIDGSKI